MCASMLSCGTAYALFAWLCKLFVPEVICRSIANSSFRNHALLMGVGLVAIPINALPLDLMTPKYQ